MKHPIKLKIHSDKEGNSKTCHYHIGIEYTHERFNIDFLSLEQFTKGEADTRVIRMAADLNADTDGIVLAK